MGELQSALDPWPPRTGAVHGEDRVADLAVRVAHEQAAADEHVVPASPPAQGLHRRAVDRLRGGGHLGQEGHAGGEELRQGNDAGTVADRLVHCPLGEPEVGVDVPEDGLHLDGGDPPHRGVLRHVLPLRDGRAAILAYSRTHSC